ncbi:hypothetical protein [Pseudomonas laurylsulfativorans]|uniref:hypothetical protein n=1 Tax=Pseudomonas laurylsulfativorans TaxID=1943631 RepID=UPI00197CEE0A|nr:hypothetical protein [Pseudomonas laurylsulfativorans]
MPAMVVNDDEYELDKRGALESIAGKPAPTGIALSVFPGIARRVFLPSVLFRAPGTQVFKSKRGKAEQPDH